MKTNKNKDRTGERDRQQKKTELANRVAAQSRKMRKTYERLGNALNRTVRWISSFFDKVLFNRKNSKLTALVLAVLMYLTVNYNRMSSLTSGIQSSKTRNDVTVTAEYNSDTFELSGLPSTADVTILGDIAGVTGTANTTGRVVADLRGLTEGTHVVTLKGEGFAENVEVQVSPREATITLRKKTTQQFSISYDLINQDETDKIYSIGTPEFSSTQVNVRASRNTLDSIAFVKALIDVKGQTKDFEQDAVLVAYDSAGQVVNADIVPNRVHVKVPVSSLSRTVGVNVEIQGSMPQGKAIDSISTDQQTVTIYGPQEVLDEINSVTVSLNVSTITKDAKIIRPITLPSGVNASSVSQITLSVRVKDGISRTINDVTINYRNNRNNYMAVQPDNKTTTSVTVFGTEDNIRNIEAQDIDVYIDMSDAQPGLQTFRLQVVQPADGLTVYSLSDETYSLQVLGDSSNTEEGVTDNG